MYVSSSPERQADGQTGRQYARVLVQAQEENSRSQLGFGHLIRQARNSQSAGKERWQEVGEGSGIARAELFTWTADRIMRVDASTKE